MIEKLKQKFNATFDADHDGVYFSPGRINLIGEHTDYNGGNVFPCAITNGTYGVARKRSDHYFRVYSENFPDSGIIQFSFDELDYLPEHDWANYIKGMFTYILEADYSFANGFDIYFYGNIPNGAGLSSSASIELLTGVIVSDLTGFNIDMLELVQLGKKVENQFIGVNSGIMDQFAIGMSKKDKAILLDCNTLDYELVPFKLLNQAVVIMNTNKRRELADSKYNERRSECEEALRRLQTTLSISALGELDEATFEAHTDLIGDQVLERRARHAVTENQRTLKAKQALEKNDLAAFGKLLNASHQSLKDDYEVTGIELDTLVAAAQKQPGVLGARMTGAGFGGCAIALVDKQNLDEFIKQVGAAYLHDIGYAADFYIAETHDGAGRIA